MSVYIGKGKSNNVPPPLAAVPNNDTGNPNLNAAHVTLFADLKKAMDDAALKITPEHMEFFEQQEIGDTAVSTKDAIEAVHDAVLAKPDGEISEADKKKASTGLESEIKKIVEEAQVDLEAISKKKEARQKVCAKFQKAFDAVKSKKVPATPDEIKNSNDEKTIKNITKDYQNITADTVKAMASVIADLKKNMKSPETAVDIALKNIKNAGKISKSMKDLAKASADASRLRLAEKRAKADLDAKAGVAAEANSAASAALTEQALATEAVGAVDVIDSAADAAMMANSPQSRSEALKNVAEAVNSALSLADIDTQSETLLSETRRILEEVRWGRQALPPDPRASRRI
jgi:hypothetical protein